jgi:hypothetical protein
VAPTSPSQPAGPFADEPRPVPPPPASAWTTETLLEHLKALIAFNRQLHLQQHEAAQRAVDAALAAAKEAVQKAETASEKRFDAVNEFRATLGDQQRTLMPRQEAEIRFAEIDKKLDALQHASAGQGERRRGSQETWGFVVGAVGVLIALLTLALRFVGPP